MLLKKLAPHITISEMLAFLYVAENPGVRVKELAVLMASNAREAVSRHLYLTEAGVELVQRLDALIESARPIGVRATPTDLKVRR